MRADYNPFPTHGPSRLSKGVNGVGGIVAGVHNVGEKLKEYFPAEPANRNELSDQVSEG